MIAHTPGPWNHAYTLKKSNIDLTTPLIWSDADGVSFRERRVVYPLWVDERMYVACNEANAKLIAAAPEMYEIIVELIDIIDNSKEDIDNFTTQPAKALLKKIR